MLEIGQEVVIMSAPGRFRILEIHGETLTIENEQGLKKQVPPRAARPVPSRDS